jgi:hypothetical protein
LKIAEDNPTSIKKSETATKVFIVNVYKFE